MIIPIEYVIGYRDITYTGECKIKEDVKGCPKEILIAISVQKATRSLSCKPKVPFKSLNPNVP
ncbi:hypothetical protein ADICYQ_3044 [Cyclobacterium qasimii M12-11B]|uniref:Uncharacterized protein n=2 Tax=Cyclobacterium qasimii TaxID=1350429 RepID=S7VEJ4_9BACT|nr:hypothetical protein ADICYQ_3044 [Cyclobacterium qasimii M12-11B]GEO23014.1 hypothetical protein CQA01_35480 [Cyclobacterium qasimii]